MEVYMNIKKLLDNNKNYILKSLYPEIRIEDILNNNTKTYQEYKESVFIARDWVKENNILCNLIRL